MKTRIISMLLTIVMILACFSGCDSLIGDGNTTAECQHKDANDDNLCDKCGNDFSDGKDQVTPQCNHRDADDNFKCDKCGALYTDGNETGGGATKCEHKDSNGDDLGSVSIQSNISSISSPAISLLKSDHRFSMSSVFLCFL